MKRLLFKGLMLLAVALFCIVIPLGIIHLINGKKENYILDKPIQSVIFGHSHSQCPFNDSLLPGFLNLSQSGEGYFFSYFKIKKVLNVNPHIKSVF